MAFRALLVAVSASLALVAGPAAAAGFVDAATGFAVDPPAPFLVAPAKSPSYDVATIINSATGSPSLGVGDDYLCQIGFKAEAQSADVPRRDRPSAASAARRPRSSGLGS